MTDTLDKATLEAIREKSAWLSCGRRGEAAYMAVADDVPVLLAVFDAVVAEIAALRDGWKRDAAQARMASSYAQRTGNDLYRWHQGYADALERCAEALGLLEDGLRAVGEQR